MDGALRHGRPVILVGAANNEHKGASVAIFDGGHVAGSAPAVVPKYRCVDCTAGGPDEFLVFPRACWQGVGVGGETSAVRRAWVDALGGLSVRVDMAPTPVAGFNLPVLPVLHFKTSPAFDEAGVEVDTSYLLVHRQHERSGVLGHSFNDADGRDLLKVVRWENGRFVRLRPGKVTQ